jgi:hypothetical protein
VIFVLEWPKGEFVSFIGFILLTKSLSCNDVVLTGIPFYFRLFRYSEFISLIWKVPYYDKFQCHKASRRQFQSSRKILWSFQLSRSRIPYSHPDGPVKRLDALLYLEDSDSLACTIWMSGQHVPMLFSVREESRFPLQTRIEKDSLQLSGR